MLSPKFSLFYEQVEADSFLSSLNDEEKTSHSLIWLACCEVMSPVQHPSLLDWDDLTSGNASGKSEKRTAGPRQQFPQDVLNVPSSLVNRSRVTVLKHIPPYCNRECLNLKVTLYFAKTLCEGVWGGGVSGRRMSQRLGSGDKIFVVFKNKFHNLPWLIAFYSQSRQGISFAAMLCSRLAGVSWNRVTV